MKKLAIAILVVLSACATKSDDNKYDPSRYLDDDQRKEVLSGVVTYIFSAPKYTSMKDRFNPEHKHYYDSISQRLFSLDRFYADDHQRRYFLVVRPGSSPDVKRAVGGYFDLTADKQFKDFREAFVTPLLPDSVARGRGRFLFDKMVNNDLDKYVKMKTYAQWPNPISYYDTTLYEWKMDVSLADSVRNQ